MSVTSVVQIWNLATSRMGHGSVDSESEISALGDICRAAWPTQRDRILEKFDWDFARRIILLTKINDSAELVDGWSYAYEWPQGDILAFRGILNPTFSDVAPVPYTTMLRAAGNDRKIMTDLDSAQAMLTEKITDVSRYPASLVYSLSWAMQGEIEGAIGKQETKVRLAAQFLKNSDDIARVAVMNQEQPRTPEDKTPLSIAARS